MTITQLSEKLDVSQDTLNYYEHIGLIPDVNRNKSGIRVYSQDDCEWIEFIHSMLVEGVPIEVLIEHLKF